MVPISKSIWPLILFVCANFYFVAITRFNSSFCFSKTFFQERSKASPPNFAPPFCALCLIVCDFLPKTWDLGRKTLPGSGLALSVIADAMPPLPKGEALAKPQTLHLSLKLYRYAKGSPLGRAGKPDRAWLRGRGCFPPFSILFSTNILEDVEKPRGGCIFLRKNVVK